MDKFNQLKRAVRRKVFSGSYLLEKSNKNGLEIIPSKKYHTQILQRGKTKYVRINEKDIDENIDNLLSLMIGMDEPDEESYKDEVYNSVKINKELDGLEVDTPDELEELPIKVVTKSEDESKAEEEKEEENCSLYDDTTSEATSKIAKEIKNMLADEPSEDKEAEPAEINRPEDLMDSEPSLRELNQTDTYSAFIDDRNIHENISKQLPLANKLAKQLIKAFKGRDGKSKSISPSKRISSRDLILGRDKVYITKKLNEGKKIKMNLLIDMSGSMYGEPITNAALVIGSPHIEPDISINKFILIFLPSFNFLVT